MLKLFIGLPASGKSRAAVEAILKGKGKVKRVERDLLREMLDASVFTARNEKIVTDIQALIIDYLLAHGKDVIVSDTNLNPTVRQKLADIGKRHGVQVYEDRSFLAVDVDECIRRDLARPKSVGEHVIRRMYNRYIQPRIERGFNATKENVVICDLDGTLADLAERNPYDASTCEQDHLRVHVAQSVLALVKATNAKLFLFSGRHDTHRPETVRWLMAHDIPFDELHMRAAGDSRKDTIIKEEIFDKVVGDKYNVVGVFDDRPSVVRLWRSLGLPVFDVGVGIEF